jgi:NAD(P)-dependent dehydrogenase (short-subunit alcohol dehydrogenase family)
MRSSPTVVVTGATDGLGRALALQLAGDGAQLVLHGRDPSKLDKVAREIADFGTQPPTVLADFAALDQVRLAAAELRSRLDRVDVLVNNAGIGAGGPDRSTRQLSRDGYELRFAVNYLAGFLFTRTLLPLLQDSEPARVVNVASIGQHPIDFDDLMIERDYSGTRAYGQSKLAQIMFGFELADQLAAGDVTVNSVHPGTFMPTKIVLEDRGASIEDLQAGVASVRRLVSDTELGGTTGRFFDHTRAAEAHPQAYNEQARAELWRRSLELVDAA